MTRIVIDTDPGVDDAHALMMALAHPQAQIEAITTVSGNVPLEKTTRNALIVLEVFDSQVPVFAGCTQAILARHPDASYVHGDDGLGNSGLPAPKRAAQSEHAVQALIRLGHQMPGEITLVAIGPLTNLALATRIDPSLPERYKRLVVMGGAVRGMGNTPKLSTEFNFYTDPEAAAIVLAAWETLTLISWEATMAHPFGAEQIEALGSLDNPRSRFFKRISENTVQFIQQILGRKMLFAPDPLAVAVALEPEIIKASEKHYVQVEVGGEYTRGQTIVDWFDQSEHNPNVEIVLEVDMDRMWELMQASVA